MRLVSRIFFCYVEEIDAKGKTAWRSLAERHLAFLGQTVLLTDGPDEQERHTGILEGLDDFGGLRLRNRKGTNSFLSHAAVTRSAMRGAGNGLPQRCGGGSQVSPMPFRGAS